MILPYYYFELNPCDEMPIDKWCFHNLRGFHEWVNANKPDEIEMTEKQWWNFTELQPTPYEEKYWRTFCGIPLRVPGMEYAKQQRLGILNNLQVDETEEATKRASIKEISGEK